MALRRIKAYVPCFTEMITDIYHVDDQYSLLKVTVHRQHATDSLRRQNQCRFHSRIFFHIINEILYVQCEQIW